ncbi:autotransporter-associated beta strand repeat-containing protein [Pontiella agarivorans]|uniref:Autotransporter-associated beta strand repeat-containing protein n=1 Tax=Pontiella agarivorans TaxID=3038953 RepID=A0ABU5N0J4_9BACT|nr:autotransporter-associated beta strand repeat-containing protein [Pontiella agarivorans]MDZ8119965.1 autotransporter-associated beta strand repeat-containing protein [Pontiella agarivorans]
MKTRLPVHFFRGSHLLPLAILMASPCILQGATRTWRGGYGNYWSTALNWEEAVVPVAGDDLVFRSGALNPNNINNLGNLTFHSITFNGDGCVLSGIGNGETIGLIAGIRSTSSGSLNRVELNIELAASQTNTCSSGSTLYVDGDVNLGTHRLCVDGNGDMHLCGVISGTGGGVGGSGLSKYGYGTLWLEGSNPNSYTGDTWVDDGEMVLAKVGGNAIPYGTLEIGGGGGFADTVIVREEADYQIGTIPVKLYYPGWLDVDDYRDTIGSLTFVSGGHAGSSSSGKLSVGGDIGVQSTSISSALIDGNLGLGSLTRTIDVENGSASPDLEITANISGNGGMIKTGNGQLLLSGNNTYGGTTVVNEGYVYLGSDTALGSTASGTTVGGSADISILVLLDNVSIGEEELVLERVYTDLDSVALYARDNTGWAGNVILNENSAIYVSGAFSSQPGNLVLSGAVGGPGSLTILGNEISSLTFSGSAPNTYDGDTYLQLGTLYLDKQGAVDGALPGPGGLYVGSGSGVWDSIVVRWLRDFQVNENVDVHVVPPGLLDLNGCTDILGNLYLTSAGAETDGGILALGGAIEADVTTNRNAFISGNLTLMSGMHTLEISEGATLSFGGGCVNGSGDILKTGEGELALYGSNTFSGAVVISEGTLFIANGNALGSSAGITVVRDGAYIRLGDVEVADEPLTLYGSGNGNGALQHYGFGVSNSWGGAITLAGDVEIGVPYLTASCMTLNGTISGSGGLTKSGEGVLVLSGYGSNTHAGDTTVLDGTLILGKTGTSVPHSLSIGSVVPGASSAEVRHAANDEITGSVVVNALSFYDLDGYFETIENLTLRGSADVDTGTGELALSGNLEVDPMSVINASSVISGNLRFSNPAVLTVAQGISFGGSTPDLVIDAVVAGNNEIAKKGGGELKLTGANTFDGPFAVNEGGLWLDNDLGLGTTYGGTTVNGGGYLLLLNGGHTIAGEHLTLNSTNRTWGALASAGGFNEWVGDITLVADSAVGVSAGTELRHIGEIDGAGGLRIINYGTLILYGSSANSFTGDTHIDRGTLELYKLGVSALVGDIYIGDGDGGADVDVLRLRRGSQIAGSRVAMTSSGLFDLNHYSESIGSLHGEGRIALGTAGLAAGSDGTSTSFSGVIEGSGYFKKYGVGTLNLTGNNTYSGTTYVYEGTLLVNGQQIASDVSISSSATLGGAGAVGEINSRGMVSPGNSVGTLTAQSTVLQSGAGFKAQMGGYQEGDYDRLNVDGILALLDPVLTVLWDFMPAEGDSFTIIDNMGTDKVSGTFKGLEEGATFSAGMATLLITYQGGTGNDVVLDVTGVDPLEDLVITSFELSGGRADFEWNGGVPFFVIEKKGSLTNATWTEVTAPTRDFVGSVPLNTTNGFYRVTGGN